MRSASATERCRPPVHPIEISDSFSFANVMSEIEKKVHHDDKFQVADIVDKPLYGPVAAGLAFSLGT
jgi:hypothetical protein